MGGIMDTSELPLIFELREDPETGLRRVFSNDETLKSFTLLLTRIRDHANLDFKRRTELLFDVLFWRGEMEWLKKRLQIKLEEKSAALRIELRQKMGRANESLIDAHIQSDTAISKLNNMLNIANKWASIVSDSLFVLQSSHKIIGKEQ